MLTSPKDLQTAATALLRRQAVPWLCLLLAIAIAIATATLQPVAAAVPVNTGATAVTFAAPESLASLSPSSSARSTPQQAVQCEMSNRVAVDVLVSMTVENLRYLESTLCQNQALQEHPDF
jgi:hypothetical protein